MAHTMYLHSCRHEPGTMYGQVKCVRPNAPCPFFRIFPRRRSVCYKINVVFSGDSRPYSILKLGAENTSVLKHPPYHARALDFLPWINTGLCESGKSLETQCARARLRPAPALLKMRGHGGCHAVMYAPHFPFTITSPQPPYAPLFLVGKKTNPLSAQQQQQTNKHTHTFTHTHTQTNNNNVWTWKRRKGTRKGRRQAPPQGP